MLDFLKRRLKKSGVTKRQRFIAGVLISSFLLFVSEFFLGKSGIFMVFAIALISSFLFFVSIYEDMKDNFQIELFILPFFYALAFGLFYFLIPVRFLTRLFMTSLYGVGLYSLYLSLNIFTVSSIRTIALLSSARTVTFALMLLSYFFLSNVAFSLHAGFFLTFVIFLGFTFPIVLAGLWTYTLEQSFRANLVWSGGITAILLEIVTILWFWPTAPTLVALFLTGIFYALVGLSQAWFEKRLFRGVIFEYFWVAVVAFAIFLIFTNW